MDMDEISYKRLIFAWAIFLSLQISPPIFAAHQDSLQRELHDSLATARRTMIVVICVGAASKIREFSR